MSKLNRSFLKKINALLVALLAFLGFSACQSNEPGFVVRGKITNAETGQAIDGIRVSGSGWSNRPPSSKPIALYGVPTPDFRTISVYSAENGDFVKILNNPSPRSLVLQIQDIDGERNGAFRDTTVVVNFDERNRRVVIVDVALTPKIKTENE